MCIRDRVSVDRLKPARSLPRPSSVLSPSSSPPEPSPPAQVFTSSGRISRPVSRFQAWFYISFSLCLNVSFSVSRLRPMTVFSTSECRRTRNQASDFSIFIRLYEEKICDAVRYFYGVYSSHFCTFTSFIFFFNGPWLFSLHFSCSFVRLFPPLKLGAAM